RAVAGTRATCSTTGRAPPASATATTAWRWRSCLKARPCQPCALETLPPIHRANKMNKTLSALIATAWLATLAGAAQAATATAIFAGGCFWCVEKDFEKLPGVLEAVSGYTAGKTPDPTYEQVSNGHT